MRKLGSSSMRLGSTVFMFSGADFQDEKTVIVGEIFKRDSQWRFGALGQGFNGGLSMLLKHFGGVEADSSPAPTPEPEPKKCPSPKLRSRSAATRSCLRKPVIVIEGFICTRP